MATRTEILPQSTRERQEPDSLRNQRGRFLLLALLAALLLFPSIRRQGLAGYDDAYFSHEAKEMVRTGDWWNVRMNGEFNLEHPPLFMWLEASSFKLFGVNDTAAKVPGTLLGFATIVLMYFLGFELTGDSWLALTAMLVLGSTQFFLKNASHAMTDVPFTFFFALAIFLYLKGLKNGRYLALMGLPLAAAVLTRSVVGFIALAIIVSHLMLIKRYRLWRSAGLLLGVALALVLPAIWYVSQYRLHGSAFFLSHLQFLNSKIQAQRGETGWTTVFSYPIALLKYYWPWLPVLIGSVVLAWRASLRARDQAAMLLLLWVALLVVPFSIAGTRYPRYIMAVFPAFSVLSAMGLNRVLPVNRRQLFFRSACVVGCIAVCVSLVFPPKPRADDILKLAPVAQANTSPDQRVFFYTYEDERADYMWQFLWYSERYAELAEGVKDLAEKLRRADSATVITDKPSYQKLQSLLSGKTTHILAESKNLICFRVS